MNVQPNQPTPMMPETAEPRMESMAAPIWLFILLFGLLYWGMVYFDHHSGWFSPQVYAPYTSIAELQEFQPLPTGGPNLQRGKIVYDATCGLCHGPDGMGKPGQAPPYVGSEWVQAIANVLVRIPQKGLSGPIHVNGQEWNQVTSMAAMGETLSDDDLANVLSYIRTNWGNKAPAITPEEVHTVRADAAKHPGPYTEAELKALALPKK